MPDISRHLTAGEIINAAAVESGLDPVADPFASTEAAFVQLVYLLNSCGRELLTAFDWQILTKEATLTINYGTSGAYALPTDFEKMLDQTGWDRTSTYPLTGPLSPQEWQYSQANDVAGILYVTFRINGDNIKILPVPPAVGVDPYKTVVYEYLSRGWVQDANDLNRYMDFVEATTDIVLYDPVLMVKMLKLRFLGAKGFDTTDITNQFNAAFNFAIGKNQPAPVLRLVPKNEFPYIGGRDIWLINGGLN